MTDPKRYKLTVAYDGTAFHGWQRQEPAGLPVLRTGQGVLEDALVRVLRQPREELSLLGASRTDAGVHAIGQVCHLNTISPIPPERMVRAINSRLPDDLEVRGAEVVDASFDAIRDATDKQYRYRIFDAPYRPLGLRNVVYQHPMRPSFDVDRMNDAARRLVGTHDVEGFAAVAHGRATTVRTVHGCRVEEHPIPAGLAGDGAAGRELHVVISGSGFLYNMVRIVAGTLVEVGRGAMEPSTRGRGLGHAGAAAGGADVAGDGVVSGVGGVWGEPGEARCGESGISRAKAQRRKGRVGQGGR